MGPRTETGAEWAARLRRLDTCALSDSLDRCGLGGVAGGLRRVAGHRPLAGVARTIGLGPATVEPPGTHLGVRTISEIRPREVIVVTSSGREESAAWGGLLSLAAALRGVAGVVVDGLVRDVDDCERLDLPVFARGATPISARGRICERSVDEPVDIGGVRVAPGDLVLADGSGVVFVPRARARDVIEGAERIVAFESRAEDALRSGAALRDVLGSRYENLLRDTGEAAG